MNYYYRRPKGQGGLDFETDFVSAINGKSKKELNSNLASFLSAIFPNLNDTSLILAQKADPRGKSDVSIFTEEGRAEVSLKSLTGDIVHSSPNDKFIDYLDSWGVSRASIDTLLLYLYRDGTTDGSGEHKWGYEETIFRLAPRIKDFNRELNANRALIQDCVDLCLFRGNCQSIPPAGYLYHGNLNSGLWISRHQATVWALKIVEMDFIRNPHIGPLHIRPFQQTSKKWGVNDQKLHWLRLKWVGMDANLAFISKKLPFKKKQLQKTSKKSDKKQVR